MPIAIDTQTLFESRSKDDELQSLMEGTNSLKLQIAAPKSFRKTIFVSVHSLSHPGGRATLQQIKQNYVWPCIKKNVINCVRNCISCQAAKIHRHNKPQSNHIDIPDNRFDHVHLDLVVMPHFQG